MKNLHLSPTLNPSRIYLIKSNNKLGITSNNPEFTENFGSGTQNQNIYITNSEEIKEGDCSFYPTFGVGRNIIINGELCFHIESKDGVGSFTQRTYQTLDLNKKIILTTDQDLINDGVQPVDDDFLEWFVKNQSCEEVEVEQKDNWYMHTGSGKYWEDEPVRMKGLLNLGDYIYKIIIPKEEPKPNLEKLLFLELVKELSEYYNAVSLIEEPKQEYESKCICDAECKGFTNVKCKKPTQETTLEEAAENYTKDGTKHCIEKTNVQLGFIEGAKWQAERSYSEEEVNEIMAEVWNSCEDNETNETFTQVRKRILEQFKKK